MSKRQTRKQIEADDLAARRIMDAAGGAYSVSGIPNAAKKFRELVDAELLRAWKRVRKVLESRTTDEHNVLDFSLRAMFPRNPPTPKTRQTGLLNRKKRPAKKKAAPKKVPSHRAAKWSAEAREAARARLKSYWAERRKAK